MTFSYGAFDKSGKSVAGVIEAADADDARAILSRQGLFVSDVEAQANSTDNSARPSRRLRSGQRLKHLAAFARQTHVLVSSGTPLVQAMGAIERQCENATWRKVITDLRTRLEEGVTLADAMAQQPEYFDSVCRSLMAAGESGGNLAQMLERLAGMTRKQLQLRSTLVGAMVYPCLLLAIGSGVLVLMLLFVLPRFTGLFETLDVPLPPTTRALLWLSTMMQSYWWAALLILGGGIAAFYWWIGSNEGRRTIDTLMLRLPKVGRITRGLLTARVARMLGTLLESKVSLLQSLQLTKLAAGNFHYVELLAQTEDMVSRGESISAGLASSPLIVPAVQETIRNGEESGQIGKPLMQIADFLDEENQIIVKALTSLLEPIILIVLGAIVGLIALSMFLPLFDLTAMAGGGH